MDCIASKRFQKSTEHMRCYEASRSQTQIEPPAFWFAMLVLCCPVVGACCRSRDPRWPEAGVFVGRTVTLCGRKRASANATVDTRATCSSAISHPAAIQAIASKPCYLPGASCILALLCCSPISGSACLCLRPCLCGECGELQWPLSLLLLCCPVVAIPGFSNSS